MKTSITIFGAAAIGLAGVFSAQAEEERSPEISAPYETSILCIKGILSAEFGIAQEYFAQSRVFDRSKKSRSTNEDATLISTYGFHTYPNGLQVVINDNNIVTGIYGGTTTLYNTGKDRALILLENADPSKVLELDRKFQKCEMNIS